MPARVITVFLFLGLLIPLTLQTASAQDSGLVTYKALPPEAAMTAAMTAMQNCSASGYQVAVAVVDRGGNLQALVRDRYAGPHTPDTARRKAWTAVSFRSNTSALAETTGPDAPNSGVRHVTGALMLGGGVLIEAGDGALVGGIGVSGAPSGDLDDACAEAGLEAIADLLAF